MGAQVETLERRGNADDSQQQAFTAVLRDSESLERGVSGGRSTSAGSARSSTGSIASNGSVPVNAQAKVSAFLKACPMQEWHSEEFEHVKYVMKAQANHGHVSLMKSLKRGGQFVAVKHMPNEWVGDDHADFLRVHPKSREQPWLDVAITVFLHKERYPYLCEPLGVFRCSSSTYVVSSFASHGDLFGLIEQWPCPGFGRESDLRPLLHQVITAVKHLHDLGIAHRDISPENIVVATDAEGRMNARLIDFGMATFSRRGKGAHGKSAFEAPEMHDAGEYDAFLTDAFSIGVVGFAMATSDYPWSATKPGRCKVFEYVQKHGLRGFCQKRQLMLDRALTISQVVSEPFMKLLEGLLDFRPDRRLTLGEACWAQMATGQTRCSALTCAWLQSYAQPEKSVEVAGFSDNAADKRKAPAVPTNDLKMAL